MSAQCNQYRDRILKSLLKDLNSEDQESLQAHLAECRTCASDRALSIDTLRQLRCQMDVPVPRHFLVSGPRRSSTWSSLADMGLAWRAGLAAAVLLIVALAGFALGNLHFRTGSGEFTVVIGKLPEPPSLPSVQAVDLQALKFELLRTLEENSRHQNMELAQSLRRELAKRNASSTRRQQKVFEVVLADWEGRMNERFLKTAAAIEDRTERSLAEMYRSIQKQRQTDFTLMTDRLNRVAAQGQVRSIQTDEILATLLQVADLSMK